jgi:hypothetical protein
MARAERDREIKGAVNTAPLKLVLVAYCLRNGMVPRPFG